MAQEPNDPVFIVDYDPAWPAAYARERQRITGALGSRITAIEHIGSTSVPGLGAKPVIDIMVGLRDLADAADCIGLVEALGYEYLPEIESMIPERRYFRRFTDGVRTHQIHMVEEGGAFWRRHLAFRDYLRTHPDTAAEYDALKRRIAPIYRDNRSAYTDAKTDFIVGIERRALAGDQ